MAIKETLRSIWQADTTAVESVKGQQRLTWVDLTFVFTANWLSMFAVVVGFSIGTMLPPRSAIAACFLGFVVTGIYQALTGAVGARLGLPTAVIMERGAGKVGAFLFAISVVIIYAWAVGLQADVAGRTWASTLGLESPRLASGILGIAMVTTGILGIEAIRRVSWVVTPIVLVVTAWGVTRAVSSAGGLTSALDANVEAQIGFWTAFSLATGAWISLATMAPDVTRFARSAKDVGVASVTSFVLGAIMPIAGVLLATSIQTSEFGDVFGQLGLPWLGVLTVTLATWMTNDNNNYTGGLALGKLLKWDRRPATAVIGGAGVVLAFLGAGAADVIGKALGWLVAAAGPAGGVMIAEYFIVSRGNNEAPKTNGVAGAVGFVLGLALSQLSDGGLKPIIHIPGFFVGIFVAVVVTVVGSAIEKRLRQDVPIPQATVDVPSTRG